MTGTASSDAAELRRIYKVGVFKVPTNRPCQRVWLPDRVFSTVDEGFQAVANQIVAWNKQGVPVLVGTRSIEKSERLSALLEAQGIEHQILNAKNHEIEAQIVAQAGQKGRVTVATNMAGPRNRHQTRRRRRRARRPARHRHRASRSPADRPAARRSVCAARATPAWRSSSSPSTTRSSKHSARSAPPASAKDCTGKASSPACRCAGCSSSAQRKKENQHFRDRKLLMHYEKQRAEMRKNMGLNPVLG